MTKRLPVLEYYRDKKGDRRWRVIAANGRIISESSEGYKSKRACKRSVDLTFCAIRSFDARAKGEGNG